MKLVSYREGFIKACKRKKVDTREVYKRARLAPSSHYRAITKNQVEMSYSTLQKLMRALDELTQVQPDARAG